MSERDLDALAGTKSPRLWLESWEAHWPEAKWNTKEGSWRQPEGETPSAAKQTPSRPNWFSSLGKILQVPPPPNLKPRSVQAAAGHMSPAE